MPVAPKNLIEITDAWVCSKCRILKPLSEFHPCPSEKKGHASRCRDCRKDERYTKAQRREYMRRYRARHRGGDS